ncbi:MAG TPA: hypothetical protein VGA09_14135 [Candidatus Binatia bacterium]
MDRRVSTIRDALIQAGVPSSKIKSGAYADAKLPRPTSRGAGPLRLLTGKIDLILPSKMDGPRREE